MILGCWAWAVCAAEVSGIRNAVRQNNHPYFNVEIVRVIAGPRKSVISLRYCSDVS